MVGTAIGNSASFKAEKKNERDIVLTRLFDAPASLIYEAMTKPEHVRKWWGILDDNYSVVECEIDLRVGGKWRFVGRGPRGDYGFHGEYKELDPGKRVVMTEIFDPFPDAAALVNTVFTTEGTKTRITVTATYPSVEVVEMVLASGMARGAGISYDMLEKLVTTLSARTS